MFAVSRKRFNNLQGTLIIAKLEYVPFIESESATGTRGFLFPLWSKIARDCILMNK